MITTLSIIIPVLNEERALGVLLPLLEGRAIHKKEAEIIIVDGGSTDGTLATARSHKYPAFMNMTVLESAAGRGRQLAAGARAAQGYLLYFLHVDSFPPVGFDDYIRQAVKSGSPAGCFRMRFRSGHPWLMFIALFTYFNWRASRGGDQSQFITRELYDKIGGYDEDLLIYEDYDLIHRLYDRDSFTVIQKTLTTSARRYHEYGVMRLQWLYLRIYWMKWRGASIEEIYEFYKSRCQSSRQKVVA